ncbi:hypothetical protein B566_EDAN001875 [Ephemera danica]|nr:hypothetical protein B566_EDAN001875 [Ephemera danica]
MTTMQRNPVVVHAAGASLLQKPFSWHPAATAATPVAEQVPKRSYDIVPVRPENFNDVMDFLRHNFFLDEPLNVHLKLVPSSEPGACPELEQFSMSSLEQGFSLMAVAPDGRVMGVCLNAVSHPGDVEELEKLALECPNQKFKIILGILAHVEKQSDVHNRFNVKTVFEVPILSVDSSCRGQGIATALLNGSLQLARRLGYPLFRIDCSSEFTARAVAKLGLHVVFSMRYDEYKPFPDQEAPLQPAAPHHEVKAMVMALNA